jgi:DNA mismatch repair ATPase MutS
LTTAYDKIATEYEAAQSAVIADALKIAETYEHVFRGVAALIAEVDCLASLAHVAATSGWTKPDIVPADSPRELAIKNLRHPVVEARVGTSYVASDVHMGEDERIVIITGPNCGGKRCVPGVIWRVFLP